MVPVNQRLQHALKEWAIAVDALSTGKTIILLRKGGIHEAGFQVQQPFVWLYPTYEHQKPDLLKPEYASKVTPVESGWHPDRVIIKSCAKITEVLPVTNREQIVALQPYHIWHEKMISDRLGWQPQRPLIVLLLRVYRLAIPKTILYDLSYGGCKSWINLIEPISVDNLNPVMSDDEYAIQAQEIATLVSTKADRQ
ncbi:MAG: hypothetical protein RLZZ574_3331 [Cyanobacteriota bacterium]|jgi:hypothetical protein